MTLELSNVATLPIKLWPGMKIGQLCFFRLSSPAEHPYGSAVYGSRYQGQRGPTPSQSYLNFLQGAVARRPLIAAPSAGRDRQPGRVHLGGRRDVLRGRRAQQLTGSSPAATKTPK